MASNNAEKTKVRCKRSCHITAYRARSGGDFNEGFEEIDRRDPDEGGGQFDL